MPASPRLVFPLLALCAYGMLPSPALRSAEAPALPPRLGALPVGKILFLGNSITLHAPAPEIGWTGNWGMAASAEDRDYAHLLVADLAGATGAKPETRVRNIADFERAYATYDLKAGLADALAFGADLVVVALGENVEEPTTAEARAAFGAAFARLLGLFGEAGNPTILVRGSFWPSPVKDGLMREAAAKVGATFVDIAALGADPANAARAEREIAHAGVAAHPGDMGMRALATALFDTLRAKAGPMILLRGEASTELAPHGGGNVYAPELHRDGDRWLLWYGGQGSDGHDRIHLAESPDARTWTRRGVVLDRGTANHVNDPSVVRVGDLWWMFHTVAETAEQDEIAAATSKDGVTWEKRGVVLGRGGADAWESWKVGRPSVLHEDGVFRLWFDGQPTPEAATANQLAGEIRHEGRAVGYAESRDGLTWKRHPKPVFREGAGAVHVARLGGRFVMLIESVAGVHWARSPDGLAWESRGLLLPPGGGDADRFGHVTPFLSVEDGQATLYFGAAGRETWDGNALASATVVLPE